MSAELDLDDVVGSFGTPLAIRELAQLRLMLFQAVALLSFEQLGQIAGIQDYLYTIAHENPDDTV